MVRKIKFILLFLFVVFTTQNIFASKIFEKCSIGLGYPYLSFKYQLFRKISIEARGAFASDIQIYGGRTYYIFTPGKKLIPFAGAEIDYVKFSDDEIDGAGYILYPYMGGEYFILNKLSLILDSGPAFIDLKEKEFDLTVDGFEWVINFGLYYYFK